MSWQNNLIISLKDGDREKQGLEDFIKEVAKSISDALGIPITKVYKNYEKEKRKKGKGNG